MATVTTTLANATLSPTTFDVTQDTVFTVTHTEGAGRWILNPRFWYRETNTSSWQRNNFTQSGENFTFTYLSSLNYSDTGTFTVDGKFALNVSPIKTDTLSNATVSPNTVNNTLGASNTITVRANDGYIFSTAPTFKITRGATLATISIEGVKKDDQTYTYTFNIEQNDYYYFDVDGAAIADPNILQIDVTRMLNVSYTSDSSRTYNSKMNARNSYSIKANAGYTILETPYLLIYRGTSVQQSFTYDTSTETWNYDQVNYYSDVTKVYLVATGVTDSPLIQDYQMINAYKLSKDNATALKKERFYNYATEQYEDLGQYILSFTRYPFTVDVGDATAIQLGFKSTAINAPVVTNQIQTLTTDGILVNGLYKTNADISQCEITAYIQYIGATTIPSEYINTTIKIEIVTDVLSNFTTLIFYSNDSVILTKTTTIGYPIPYILETDKPKAYAEFSNGVKTLETINCQIVVRQRKNTSDMFTLSKRVDLNTLTGYNEISAVNLPMIINATVKEIDDIINTLSTGVYF